MFASARCGEARADNGWTPEQTRVIALIYQYSDYYGLRDVDRDLLLRVAYRETQYRNINGDCWTGSCHSVGPFQMFDQGVWLSTPQNKAYGLAGRYNVELNVAAAAYSFSMGRQSHWSPLLKVRWLATVPPDPR
jgi:hypothetical protein